MLQLCLNSLLPVFWYSALILTKKMLKLIAGFKSFRRWNMWRDSQTQPLTGCEFYPLHARRHIFPLLLELKKEICSLLIRHLYMKTLVILTCSICSCDSEARCNATTDNHVHFPSSTSVPTRPVSSGSP
jgi:hypothetical protein